MALSDQERHELTTWLVELTAQMEDLARRARVLATLVDEADVRAGPEPPPDG